MKIFVNFFCLLFFSSVFGQKGDELLVYSMKGNVTVIENNIESKVKIGKVLKPGSSIKTQPQAKLTMVCKQGKPLSVTKEGIFPVVKWKDSCATGQNSVTSKYFQYIWDQLYVRSDEYKRDHPGDIGAVVRNDAPVRGEIILEIEFNEALDTINYASGRFPLSWTTNIDYAGKYHFKLVNAKGGKPLYKDSIAANTMPLDKLKKYMLPGNSYSWYVTTEKTGICHGGIIKCLSVKTVSRQISKLKKAIDVPEDLAAQYFRVAYLLENSHYFADAFTYYQKAANAIPSIQLHTDILAEFNRTYMISK